MNRLVRALVADIILAAALGATACSSGGGPGAGTGGTGGTGSGGTGSGGWNGHLIQGSEVAIGGYALAVQDDTTLTFEPAVATAAADNFRIFEPPSSYSIAIGSGGMTASAHWKLVQTEDTLAFDISVDASSTGGGMSATSEFPFWTGVKKPGATKFKMNVTCTDLTVSAAVGSTSVIWVYWDQLDDRVVFCGKALPNPLPPYTAGSSVEIPADEEGYAVFTDINPQIMAGAGAAGASSHASVHLEFQFVPVL